MRDEMENALKGHDADYIEMRIEDSQATRISYRGKELEDIGRTGAMGGNVRALVKGGWGFVSFNSLDNLRDKVELAVSEARIVGTEASQLSPAEPVVDIVAPDFKRDPASVPLANKKNILDQY